MSRRSGVRCTGPLESYLGGFADELARLGYTPGSAQQQLRLVARLSRWLADHDMGPAALTAEAIEVFVVVLRTVGYTVHRSSRAFAPLLDYLRRLGVVGPPAVAEELTPVEALLARYRDYLRSRRDLAGSSVRVYLGAVRPFLTGRVTGNGLTLERLTAGEVTAFGPSRVSGPSTARRDDVLHAPTRQGRRHSASRTTRPDGRLRPGRLLASRCDRDLAG